MNQDAVRAALRDLALELAGLLPERAEAIAEAFARARASPGSVEARENLRVLAHRMRGSAGSHGFEELSVEAGLIEDALLAGGDAVPAEAWDGMAERVAKIRAGAASAAREAREEGDG